MKIIKVKNYFSSLRISVSKKKISYRPKYILPGKVLDFQIYTELKEMNKKITIIEK